MEATAIKVMPHQAQGTLVALAPQNLDLTREGQRLQLLKNQLPVIGQ